MTKLQFTPQMFECCIRDDVHKVAQKHYEAWYAELNAAEAKCAELELQLEFTKQYLNPEDTSFREMMNTFKELPNDKKDKLIDLARSLAELAKT